MRRRCRSRVPIARSTAVPGSRFRSPIAITAGTMLEPGVYWFAGCVSSVSSACANIPLASARIGAEVTRRVPKTLATGLPPNVFTYASASVPAASASLKLSQRRYLPNSLWRVPPRDGQRFPDGASDITTEFLHPGEISIGLFHFLPLLIIRNRKTLTPESAELTPAFRADSL